MFDLSYGPLLNLCLLTSSESLPPLLVPVPGMDVKGELDLPPDPATPPAGLFEKLGRSVEFVRVPSAEG